MAVNISEYAVMFQQAADEVIVAESATATMEGNTGGLKWDGARYVKVPKMTMTGLGTYSRSTGYPSAGTIDHSYTQFELQWDRAARFNIDQTDIDETGFTLEAGKRLAAFIREEVVPEVDAARFAELFKISNLALRTGAYTPAVGTIYGQWKDDVAAIQAVVGDRPLICYMDRMALNKLEQCDDISKQLTVDSSFSSGAIETRVRSLDGIPIKAVPTARIMSAITLSATDGWSRPAEAMQINWIICPADVPIAIRRTERPKIIAPESREYGDAWFLGYHLYHGFLMLTNKLNTVYVSYTTPTTVAPLTATVAAGTSAGTKFTATPATGNTLAYLLQAGEITDPIQNAIPTGLTAYTSGADIAAAVATNHLGMYELDAAGHVVRFLEKTLVSGDIHA